MASTPACSVWHVGGFAFAESRPSIHSQLRAVPSHAVTYHGSKQTKSRVFCAPAQSAMVQMYRLHLEQSNQVNGPQLQRQPRPSITVCCVALSRAWRVVHQANNRPSILRHSFSESFVSPLVDPSSKKSRKVEPYASRMHNDGAFPGNGHSRE